MDTVAPNIEPMLNLMLSISKVGFMFFFIMISFRLIIYLLQKSTQIQMEPIKQEDVEDVEFEDNIKLLERYYKNDLNYIKQTIKDGKHPHINIIKENFENLIKLVNKKELILTSTVDRYKIETLSKEIISIIEKYVNLIDNLNDNLVEKELKDMKELNDEILNTINNFKINAITIDDFVCNHHISETIDDVFIKNIKEKVNDELFATYFTHENKQQYDYLKRLLINDRAQYYNSIIELLYVIIEYIEPLKNKEQYVQYGLKSVIEKGIKTTISNYIELLTVLDRISDLPVDGDVEAYEQLLDSIVDDVKNKKAVF